MKISLVSVFILLLFCILEYSCSKSTTTNSNGTAKIVVVDSIVTETPVNESLRFANFTGKYFLAVNLNYSKAYVFDLKGTLIKVIDSQGEGPLEYISIKKYGLTSKKMVAILSGKKIIQYSIEKEEVRECALPVDSFVPSPSSRQLFPFGDEKIIFASNIFENPGYRSFYENSHTLTIFDLQNCSFQNKGAYPNGSIYRKKIFPALFDPFLVSNVLENTFALWLPLDKTLYILDNESLSIKKSIPLSFENFGEIWIPKTDDLSESLKFVQINASIASIILGKNYFLVQYRANLDEEFIRYSMPEINQMSKERKYYYALFDYSGKKLSSDFENSDISYLVGFSDHGQLLYVSDKNESKEGTIYIANINIKNGTIN